jgi:mycothiol synthase
MTTTDARAATAGLTRRDLGPDDLDDVTALLRASDVAVLGRVDFTEGEIAADLRRQDAEKHGWYAADGTLLAYGWVSREADSERAELDVYVLPDHDGRLGVTALEVVEDRGRELAREAGHDQVVLGMGVYRQDARTRGWLTDLGYEVETSFTRMRIDLDAQAGVVTPAERVRVRRSGMSEEDLRVAHRIESRSFTEHFGHVEKTYESWRGRLTERGPDFAEVWLAEVDGEPVGLLVGTAQFAPDENAGYVRTLGTLPTARGIGVGTALLRAYFAASAEVGRSAVLLHVDVANVTGALRIYESVGMRPVLEIDAWTKRSPVR